MDASWRVGAGPCPASDHPLWRELGQEGFLERLFDYARLRVPPGESVTSVVNQAVLETLVAMEHSAVRYPLAYAKRVIRSTCHKVRREIRRRPEVLTGGMEWFPARNHRLDVSASDRLSFLRDAARGRLPTRQQEMMDLLLAGVSSTAELAASTGRSVGTTKATLRRLRRNLVRIMESLPEEYPRGP